MGVNRRTLLLSAVGVIGLSLVSDVSLLAKPPVPAHTTDDLQYPALASHRGGPIVNPEATMEAFRDIRDNYPGMLIEFDVHRLADGVLVVWHDKTVDGVPVKDMTTAQWRNVRVPRPVGGGSVPAPFLNEVLTEFGNTDVTLVPELKADEAISTFIEALWPYKSNIITQTFTAASTSVLVRSGFKAMQLSSSWVPPIVPGAYAVGVKHTLITPENIQNVHDAGQYFWAWTVDDQARMTDLFNMGVDGVMSNDPRLEVT